MPSLAWPCQQRIPVFKLWPDDWRNSQPSVVQSNTSQDTLARCGGQLTFFSSAVLSALVWGPAVWPLALPPDRISNHLIVEILYCSFILSGELNSHYYQRAGLHTLARLYFFSDELPRVWCCQMTDCLPQDLISNADLSVLLLHSHLLRPFPWRDRDKVSNSLSLSQHSLLCSSRNQWMITVVVEKVDLYFVCLTH